MGRVSERWSSSAAGAVIIALFALSALLAPWLCPFDPGDSDIPYQPPSRTHLLGTNDVGQDVLSELILSSRVSLPVGILAGFLSLLLGVSVGVLSGYRGGVLGEILMGVTDVFILVPGLPLMIVLASYLNPSFWNVILVVGALWWTPSARVVHARTLQIRGLPYIESTRALGYSSPYIIVHHVLVNLRDVVRARFALAVASAMLTEASLSFIGLGDPVHVSWGQMIHFAFERGGFANKMWWWVLPPGVAIATCVLGFVLIGMGPDRGSRPRRLP